MDQCQKNEQNIKYALQKNESNLIDELPSNMLITLMFITAQNYIKNPIETNTHVLYQISQQKYQQNQLTNEEQLLLLSFIFMDKDFLNIIKIEQLNQLIDYVFNQLDEEQYKIYVELLKNTIYYVCQNYMTSQLIINIIIKLLNIHYQNQLTLENSRIFKQQKCINVWNIIENISEFITDFQDKLDQSQIYYGVILPLSSDLMPQQLHVKLQDQQQVLEKRKQLFNSKLSEIQPEVVDSIYDIEQYKKLMLGKPVSQFKDISRLTLLKLILERFIQSTILDFDKEHQNAGLQAITQILDNIEKEYKNKINFMIEIHRIKELPEVPTIMIYVYNRIFKYFEDTEGQSYLDLIFDQNKLENNIQNSQALLIRVLSSMCRYIPYQCNLYQSIIEFIEDQTQQECQVDSLFAQALQDCWFDILQDKQYEVDIQLKLEDKIIKDQDEFVLKYLTPRYQHTIYYSSQDYPSMCHCYSGIICQRGISYLLKETNVIDGLILKLMRSDVEEQQIQGLTILYNVMKNLKQLFDPYIKIVSEDLIRLHQSQNKQVLYLIQLCIQQILHNISQFGLFQLVKIIDLSLQDSGSSETIKGGLDIILQILRNTGKLPNQLFRQIVQKLLPDILPLLQDLVSHQNKDIAEKTQQILLISVDQIYNAQIKTLGKRIIQCYNSQYKIRELLSDFNEIVFQNKIDRISLILLIPLCLRIMNSKLNIYSSAGSKDQNLHIKQIAATSLSLLAQISNQQDFEQFLDQIVLSLINNLNDTNDDIRNSCVISLTKVVQKYQKYSNNLLSDLIKQIYNQQNMTISERKGIVQAIVGLSYLVGKQEELIQLLDSNPLNGLLITFYLPQYVIQNIYNNTQQLELKQQFIDKFFDKLVNQLFKSVQELKEEYHDFIIKSARQLFTSFAKEKQIIVLSIQEITKYILNPNSKIRQICIILVGDIMSEIGSEIQQNVKESEEIQNVKKLLSQVYVSGIAEAKTKVFIPEKSIDYAITQITQDTYDNLCACIFILKCDSDNDVRRQAVNMWKLITVKSQLLVDRFYGKLLDNMIIAQENNIEFEAKTIESYILQAHKDPVIQLQNSILNKLQEGMNNQDADLVEKMLNLLNAFAIQSALDIDIQKQLFTIIPQLLKTFIGNSAITNSSMLILCKQKNSSNQIKAIIQPQLDQIEQSQNIEDIQNIVESIQVILQNTKDMVKILIKDSFIKAQQCSNYYIFIALLIIKNYEPDEEDDKEWIRQSILHVQNHSIQVLEYLQQLTSKQIADDIKQKKFEAYDPSLMMIKLFYQSENQDISNAVNKLVCQNIITNVIEDQIINTLILCIGMFYKEQDVQVISSLLQVGFTNIQKQQYNQIFAIILSTLFAQYKHLQQESLKLESYLELLFQQLQNYMYGISNVPVLLNYEYQVQDLITLLCNIQSYTYKDNKNYFAQQKMIACNIFIQLILTVLQTYNGNKDGEDEYIFLNTNYKVSKDMKCIQANKYSIGMIGRIVLLIKQQTVVQTSYLQVISVLARYVDIHQFESIIRGEIEKYCLINGNPTIEKLASECLVYLYRQTSKPLNSIEQLVARISREITSGNDNLQVQIQTLQQYIAYPHKGTDQLDKIEIIREKLDQLPQSKNEQVNNQMIKLVGVIIGKLLNIEPIQSELLLYNSCFQKTTTIEDECKQLIILSSIFEYGTEEQYDKIYKLIHHCLQNLNEFDEQQEKTTLTQYLQKELINIISIQQSQILVKIAQIITNILKIYASNKFKNYYATLNKQYVAIFVKCIDVYRQYEQDGIANQLLVCIEEMADIDDEAIRKLIASLTLQFVNDCFLKQTTFEQTQQTAIAFYRLRFGKQFINEILSLKKQNNAVLVLQMGQRIDQICKAIKQGRL